MELEKKKVLVIDDQQEIRELIKVTLRGTEFEVIEASNGREGILAAKNQNPDAILLDIMMPIMNGWEVSRKIRKHEDQNSKTKIIIISGIGTDLNEMVSPLYGADDYMDKPITIEALADKIRQFLEPPKEQTA